MKTAIRKKKLSFLSLLFICVLCSINQSWAQPTFKWAKSIGSEYVDGCSAMALDSSENIFLAGHIGLVPKSIPTNISVDFDLGPDEHNLTTTGSSKIFVTKRNSEGDFLWAREFGSGMIKGKNDPNSLNELSVASIATDLDGNVYITGQFKGTIDFSTDATPKLLTPTTSDNAYLLKLDKDGKFVWVKQLESSTSQGTISAIRVDRNNNIYAVGSFDGTISFKFKNGSTKTLTNPTVPSIACIYIAKLNKDGDFIWVKQIANSTINNFQTYLEPTTDVIALDLDGNLLLGASTKNSGSYTDVLTGLTVQNSVIFDLGGASEQIEKPLQGSEYGFSYVIKIDPDGKFKWIARNDPTAVGVFGEAISSVSGISTDKFGNVYYLGNFSNGPVNIAGVKKFSENPLSSSTNHERGTSDLYITKLDKDGNFVFGRQISGNTIIRSRSLAINSASEILVYGNVNESGLIDYDPLSPIQKLPTGNIGEKSYKMFLLKLTSEGKYAWAGEFGYTSFFDQPGHIALSKSGCSVYLGSTIGSVYGAPNVDNPNQTDPHEFEPRDYDPGDGTANITTKGWRDIYFSKFSDNSAPPPSITPTGSLEFCQGDSVILDAGSGFESYKWSPNGETTQTIKVNTAGNYTVAITGDCGNQISSPITTIINPLPIIDLTPDFSVPEGTETILTASSTGVLTYNWSPSDGLSCSDCASPTVTIEQPTDYCVTIMNTDSCKTTECVKISIDLLCGELFVPNSFSPNNDKINDFLEVKVKEDCIESFEFSIFNRWGEKVFESSKITDSWDGKFEGKELDNAVFVYYLKTKLKSSAEPIIKKGNVSIIK